MMSRSQGGICLVTLQVRPLLGILSVTILAAAVASVVTVGYALADVTFLLIVNAGRKSDRSAE